MRVEHLVGVLVLSGCDAIWRLDTIEPVSGDASSGVGDTGSDADAYVDPCAQSTHDEDGDTFVDACDACPGVPDDQTDGDGDGVGDMCDPSAATMDRVALFVSFAESAAPSEWQALSGSWRVENESLVLDGVLPPEQVAVVYQGTQPEPPFVLEIAATFGTLDPGAGVLSIVADGDPEPGVQCAFVRRTASDYVRAEQAQVVAMEQPLNPAVMSGLHRMVMSYDRDALLRCRFDTATTSVMMDSPLPSGRQLGFRSARVPVQIHHVTVYAH